MINLNAEFIADAKRSHVERDPRNNVGARVLDELATTLRGAVMRYGIKQGIARNAQFRHCK